MSRGIGPTSDGLQKIHRQSENGPYSYSGEGMNLSFGMQEDGNQSSCGYGLHVAATKSPDKDPNRGRAASIDMIPNQILVRNSDQRVVSFSDNDGRLMSLPLNSPIQLLLKDGQRGQIRGKDFLEVPLAVEIEGMVISEQRASAIGVAGPKTKNSGWNLEEEVSKVLEVAMTLGFDFNINEDEIGEQIARREIEDEERIREGNGK
ncbi:hypothetical protein LWI28_005562 [Acer negundo]|uniref:Uncharacterized protein n=1 Tax=Acer negundo TaxID=4023 RepID=A0AAD5J7X0_ACENE|nr:hypothetical protein LWI28_005562 [Acer negundo]